MSEDHEKNETNQIEIYFQLKYCLPLQNISREKEATESAKPAIFRSWNKA